jgi:hypothetical protein
MDQKEAWKVATEHGQIRPEVSSPVIVSSEEPTLPASPTNNMSPHQEPVTITLTGGPCGGKSTVGSKIADRLQDLD